MAFTDEPTRVVLEFEGTGLQVVCTTSTLAARVAVERFENRITAGRPIRQKDLARLAVVFVQHVAFWNIRRESGALVPLTPEGVLSLDRDTTLVPVLRQWMTVVARPPVPAAAEVEDAPVETPEPVAPVDEAEAFLDQLEARTLTQPGEGELQVTEPEPVLEPA